MTRVFNETGAELILLYLETRRGLRREEIPHNVEVFSSGLTVLLGSSTRVLERQLIKRLCSMLQLEFDAEPKLRFADHVERLRKRFEESKKDEN